MGDAERTRVGTVLVGFDGGQSASAAAVGLLDGSILGFGLSGPMEPPADSRSRDHNYATVRSAVSAALTAADVDADRIGAAYLATTAGGAELEAAVRSVKPTGPVRVVEDVRLVLPAAGLESGLGLIAGAGAVCVADSGTTSTIRGGWGWLLGDGGSGYWIGRRALRLAVAELEESGCSRLGDLLLQQLNTKDFHELFAMNHRGDLPRHLIADLTRPVHRLAEAGDPVAGQLLREAAEHLCALVSRAARAEPRADPVVVPTGGLVRDGGPVLTHLRAAMSIALPDHRVALPRVPPVVAALSLALELAGGRRSATLVRAIDGEIDLDWLYDKTGAR